jgi:hypothetical protein
MGALAPQLYPAVPGAIPALSVGPFVVTHQGLVIQGDPTIEECTSFAHALYTAKEVVLWALADLLNYVEIRYGETYAQIATAFPDFSIDYLRHLKWVGGQFPLGHRRETLSLDHHRVVAGLPEPEREAWLDQAEQGEWRRDDLRLAIRESKDVCQAFREDLLRLRMQADGLLARAPTTEDRDALLTVLAVLDDRLEEKGGRD